MREGPREVHTRPAGILRLRLVSCQAVGRRLTDQERAAREMSEAAFQRRVLYRARKYGWKTVHLTAKLVAIGADGQAVYATDEAGFPDLMLFKPGRAPIFAELKKELGKLTDGQWEWLDLLIAAGQFGVVWRPSMLPEIEEILRG